MADVFISYSRRDTEFVRRLHDYLIANGKDVWVDWEDIPPGSAWERDIDDSIDGAESFVFVLSRSSVASEYCLGEFGHAGKRGKRIIPVACEDLPSRLAPEGLRQLNWIWCRDGDDRDAAFARLLPALDTDLEWSRAHTRLLERAVEWDKRRDGSLLLRGNDLEHAVEDLAANAGKQPAPTELQREYVLASRRASKKRQRIILASVSTALAVSVGLGIVALLQRNAANERARQARSQALAAEATAALERNPPTALARAVEAVETKRTPEARLALRRAILANPVAYVVRAAAKPPSEAGAARDALQFSPDGELLLGRTPDGHVYLWHADDGRPVESWPPFPGRAIAATFDPRGRYVLVAGKRDAQVVDVRSGMVRGDDVPPGRVVGAGFTVQGPRIVVAAAGGGVRIVDALTGRGPWLRGRPGWVRSALVSGDGSRVLTLAGDVHRARVWNASDGGFVASLPGAATAAISRDGQFVASVNAADHGRLWAVGDRVPRADLGRSVKGVAFASDGTRVVAVGGDGEAGVWRPRDGRQVAAFPAFGTLTSAIVPTKSPFVPGAIFTPDGALVAVADADGIVRVFELATKKQVGAFRAGWANALAFAPRGGLLAAMTWNGDVVAARAPAGLALRAHLRRYEQCADFAPVVSADGRWIMTRDADGAAVWSTGGRRQGSLSAPSLEGGEDRNVAAGGFSADGAFAAVSGESLGNCPAGKPYQAAVWRLGHRRPLQVLPSRESGMREVRPPTVMLDQHGGLIAVGPRAWRTGADEPLRALDGIVALRRDGGAAVVVRDRGLAVVDVQSGTEKARLEADFGLASQARKGTAAVVLGRDNRVLTKQEDGTVTLWDGTTGERIAGLTGQGSGAVTAGFGDAGRLALVTFLARAAVFRASDGQLVSAKPGPAGRRDNAGAFPASAVSPDAYVAAYALEDGGIEIVDLATGIMATVHTDTALPLDTLTFGAVSSLIVARDRKRDVHVVRCEICAPEEQLTARARERLEVVTGFQPMRPSPVEAAG